MIQAIITQLEDGGEEWRTSAGNLRMQICHDGLWYCTCRNLPQARKETAEDLRAQMILLDSFAREISTRNAAILAKREEDRRAAEAAVQAQSDAVQAGAMPADQVHQDGGPGAEG